MLMKQANAGKVAVVCAFFFATVAAFGQPANNKNFITRAEKEFQRTQKIFQADRKNSTNAWQFAGACFDLADLATNETRRAEIANLGIAACEQLVAREPKSAPGHYYLAMNYGELAQAEAPSLAAYKLVKDIEREFKSAADLDEHFDFAGPPRNLGLLYRDAPGWPISIGSKHKAREFLERAAALAPSYPENQLNLAESFLQWRERDEAEKALKKADAIWSAAQTNLVGEAWAQDWDDWTMRRAAAKNEFQKVFKYVP
jgi:tetratricopeptide (TPR) repeat protein